MAIKLTKTLTEAQKRAIRRRDNEPKYNGNALTEAQERARKRSLAEPNYVKSGLSTQAARAEKSKAKKASKSASSGSNITKTSTNRKTGKKTTTTGALKRVGANEFKSDGLMKRESRPLTKRTATAKKKLDEKRGGSGRIR